MWAVEGQVSKIFLGTSPAGLLTVSGIVPQARVSLHTEQHPIEFGVELRRSETAWRLLPGSQLSGTPASADFDWPWPALGAARAQYEENPSRALAHIALMNEGNTELFPKITVLLPDHTFAGLWSLLSVSLTQPALRYYLHVDFLGFRAEHVDSKTPTYTQFRDGAPILCSDVSFSVRAQPEAEQE